VTEERVQRRLAAILAADVVGYSRLVGEDEAGTRAQFNSHFHEMIKPTIAARQGRIFKTMGDGFLVEFASVVDAVQCAVEVQDAMAERNVDHPMDRRMDFRIGINLGDVIIEEDDIHGEGVNVAARLEGLADPCGVVISGKVYAEVRTKLDFGFDDLGPQIVKNIAEPVRAFRISMQTDAPKMGTSKPLPLPDKPSIAVLPFNNMSGDPDQEYFADGIAEDVITGLSRFSWFFVIARNSSFAYKGASPDIRRVAHELGVQYVLEGGIRKAGDRVRITSQLIDALSGRHIWADRFDREIHDIFAVQDEITEAIIGAVAPSFVLAEERRVDRKPPENFDAWDYALRGNQQLWRLTKDGLIEARRLFRLATNLDPKSSTALNGLSLTSVWEFMLGLTDSPSESLSMAHDTALQAIRADQQDAWGHATLGFVNVHRREHDVAIAAYRRAIEINPNLAFAEGALGVAYAWKGNYEEAVNHSDRAARLSPHDPARVYWYMGRGAAAFVAGKYEEASEWGRRLTETFPDFGIGWRVLATSLTHADRIDDARAAIDRLLRLAPNANLRQVEKAVPASSAGDLERFVDGLRKAGLPE
jgi:TolB-like protein/Flp pilus assembly protein TadD